MDERNAVVIADPKDHEALARRIRRLITDGESARAIGGQGQRLARFWDEELESFDEAARTFAAELQRLARRRSARAQPDRRQHQRVKKI